jgi:hypothetical protein
LTPARIALFARVDRFFGVVDRAVLLGTGGRSAGARPRMPMRCRLPASVFVSPLKSSRTMKPFSEGNRPHVVLGAVALSPDIERSAENTSPVAVHAASSGTPAQRMRHSLGAPGIAEVSE